MRDENTGIRVFPSFNRQPVMRISTLLRTILAMQPLVVRGFHFDDLGLVVDVAPYQRSIRCGDAVARHAT